MATMRNLTSSTADGMVKSDPDPEEGCSQSAPGGLPMVASAEARHDDEAYGQLFSIYARQLYGYLLRLCRQHDRAEDLVQITFEKLHRARHRCRDDTVGPWLFAIARNAFYDDQRARRVRREVLTLDGIFTDSHAPAVAPSAEDRALLLEALDRLPEAYRDSVVLTKWLGYSGAEAAEQLETCSATVKVWAHRGCRKLQEALQP